MNRLGGITVHDKDMNSEVKEEGQETVGLSSSAEGSGGGHFLPIAVSADATNQGPPGSWWACWAEGSKQPEVSL